jgi:type I restriction enzyme S subunit
MTSSLTHSAPTTEKKTWKLKDISLKIGSGATPRGGEAAYLKQKVNYAFVRSQNVFDFKFNSSEVRFISDEAAQKLKGVHLQKDDILLNITGDGRTFARCCIVDEEVLPAAVNQHVAIIRLDQQVCLPGYLLAYLCLPETKAYIASFNAGGSRRAITKGHIESFEIPAVPIEKQKVIQDVLFSLISKIDLNQTLNQTLEEIAQAIFKSWFVDFDPVKAKMSGEKPEGMDAATARLFPKKLVESELGLIPDGWEVKKIGELVNRYSVGKKYSNKTAAESGMVPILDQGKSGIIGYHNDKPGVEASLEDPLIVFANHTCYMKLVTYSFSAIQNVLPFKLNNCDIYWSYIATHGKQKFIEYKGHWPDFIIHELAVPTKELMDQFGVIVKPLYSQIASNEKQNQSIASLRDILLPKLLKVDVELTNEELTDES